MNATAGIRVRIAAPDAPSAFLLERSLTRLRASTFTCEGDWWVELTCAPGDVDEVETIVAHWLRESAATEATVEIGEKTIRVEA